MSSILIIEDEPTIADSLLFVLKQEGFDPHWVNLGELGLHRLSSQSFDFVILDVGLPDINGFEVCKRIRKFSDIPILFLTARAEEIDRIVGLEIGADDYVVKPFSPREVATRVKVILKRFAGAIKVPSNVENQLAADSQIIQEFCVDESKNTIEYRGEKVLLTPLEYKLLKALVERPTQVFSREQLLDKLGVSVNAAYDRSIDTHIKSIRAKLRAIHTDLDPIQTQRGFGYYYQPSDSSCR